MAIVSGKSLTLLAEITSLSFVQFWNGYRVDIDWAALGVPDATVACRSAEGAGLGNPRCHHQKVLHVGVVTFAILRNGNDVEDRVAGV